MTSEVSAEDPCPQLPESLVDPERVRKMVREIKGFSTSEPVAEEPAAEEPRIDERAGLPQPLARSVIATRRDIAAFGELLASERINDASPAPERNAFVADGSAPSPCIDGLQLRHRLNEMGSVVGMVVLTGYADVPTAVRLMEDGVLTLLEKPFQPDRRRRAVLAKMAVATPAELATLVAKLRSQPG